MANDVEYMDRMDKLAHLLARQGRHASLQAITELNQIIDASPSHPDVAARAYILRAQAYREEARNKTNFWQSIDSAHRDMETAKNNYPQSMFVSGDDGFNTRLAELSHFKEMNKSAGEMALEAVETASWAVPATKVLVAGKMGMAILGMGAKKALTKAELKAIETASARTAARTEALHTRAAAEIDALHPAGTITAAERTTKIAEQVALTRQELAATAEAAAANPAAAAAAETAKKKPGWFRSKFFRKSEKSVFGRAFRHTATTGTAALAAGLAGGVVLGKIDYPEDMPLGSTLNGIKQNVAMVAAGVGADDVARQITKGNVSATMAVAPRPDYNKIIMPEPGARVAAAHDPAKSIAPTLANKDREFLDFLKKNKLPTGQSIDELKTRGKDDSLVLVAEAVFKPEETGVSRILLQTGRYAAPGTDDTTATANIVAGVDPKGGRKIIVDLHKYLGRGVEKWQAFLLGPKGEEIPAPIDRTGLAQQVFVLDDIEGATGIRMKDGKKTMFEARFKDDLVRRAEFYPAAERAMGLEREVPAAPASAPSPGSGPAVIVKPAAEKSETERRTGATTNVPASTSGLGG